VFISQNFLQSFHWQMETNKIGRQALFYGICIWMRFLLVIIAAVLCFHYPRQTGLAVGILGALVFIGNMVQVTESRKKNIFGARTIWWSRPIHGLLALMAAVAGFALASRAIPWWVIPTIALADVLFGILCAYRLKPYN
jgi:hypothetical protein